MISIEYLRQFRIGPFTIFDTGAAYLGVLILSPILSWLMSKLHLKVPIISWLWFTLPLSVISHILLHQKTPLMKILANPGQFQFYIVMFILLAMVYLGFRKICKISPS
jgi:hypothetical protein